ncbi:MAG: glycoside hydrolase family 13 protein [Limnochordales bacterium]|nr:glycoside hydrolase family 13 protein [Limnochordales bacterium]
MQLAALFHACRSPYAYPVGLEHLRIILKAARGDLAAAVCVHGDRYSWPPDLDRSTPMERLGDDGVHEYWGVTIPAPTRRIRYSIYVRGRDGDYAWLTEYGIAPRRPRRGFFEYPYIHRNDAFAQPEWLRYSVFYQIFPDRFCNGDPTNDPPNVAAWGTPPTGSNRMGGDLAGIRQKLDYLQDLGIGCIYLTPIFAAPSNHKYDTADDYRIDPQFGTEEELKALVKEAHGRGIRILLDAVFNHAGKEWFAFRDVIEKGKDSRYAGWFYDLHSFPVNPEVCNYETFANRIASMPKLDTGNPECRDYLLGVAEYWIRQADIDGWRLDVANEVDHRFWRAFRDRVKGVKPDAFILGEVWHNATDWLQGDQFDSVMNYPWRHATLAFLSGQLDAAEYDRLLCRMRFTYTSEMVRGLVNLLGSHDTPRVRTVLGSREKAAQAAVLLLTSEGVPMIYYGDEVGLEGKGDPDCRRCYPWDDPKQRDTELLSLYRRLIAIRKAFPWLNDGAWETFVADPVTGLFGFRRLPSPLAAPERPANEEGLYVVINNSSRGNAVTVPAGVGVHLVDLLEVEMLTGRVEGDRLELPPHGIAILAPATVAAAMNRKPGLDWKT